MAKKYETKYIYKSRVKNGFVDESGNKLRISGEAKEAFYKYIDEKVDEALKSLVDKLPRKQRGKHKGELKRITLKLEDLEE